MTGKVTPKFRVGDMVSTTGWDVTVTGIISHKVYSDIAEQWRYTIQMPNGRVYSIYEAGLEPVRLFSTW